MDKHNIEFIDLFDVDTIQKLQDSFSEATGVASLITRPDGSPITKPSNFCSLCNLIRSSEKGLRNCANSDAALGRQHQGGPIFQKCLSGGLWDGGASISVGDKHIANWLIGQIINEEVDESTILAYADEIGADKSLFAKELKKVTRMSLDRFKRIADALFIFANQLSEKAYQNLQLKLHQDHLQDLVEQKTIELQQANQELQTINDELNTKSEIILNQNVELKKALENLKETKVQLIQADKMASLGVLTAGVAHEINNPLNFLVGSYYGLNEFFSEYDLKNNDTTLTLLESMKLGIDRISNIVNGLNQFSRDSKEYDEDCNVHTIIDNCLVILHNQLKYKIEIKKDYSPTTLFVKGNVGKLHQVFTNVFTNAIHAIKSKGKIAISTRNINGKCLVEIEDNGCGIKKELLHKITDPFFTTKDPGKGTGLGLSITYAIIKKHGGVFKIDSEENKGTKVSFEIPLRKE